MSIAASGGVPAFAGLSLTDSEDMALVEAHRGGALFVEFRFDPTLFELERGMYVDDT